MSEIPYKIYLDEEELPQAVSPRTIAMVTNSASFFFIIFLLPAALAACLCAGPLPDPFHYK